MGDYAHPDKLVSTAWVLDHLNDPGIRLIEVDVDTEAYQGGHPPGATAWNWTTQLQDQVQREIAGREAVESLLREAGVHGDTTPVLYGDNNNWFAAYALWLLELYGVTTAKLMNGGRGKWLSEGRPLTTDVPRFASGTIALRERDERTRARVQDVLAHVSSGGRLVDVRSPDEFNGLIVAPPGLSETAQRKGHIPGAVSVPWGRAVSPDGTFKPADELRALYASAGVDHTRPVVAYCRIGERSSHTWFVLRHLLGYDARNYDGSWTEWGSMVGTPIANPSLVPAGA